MSDVQSHAIDPWIEILWEHGGSDLLLSGGSAPRIRVDGKLGPIEGAEILTGQQVHEFAMPLLTPMQRSVFDDTTLGQSPAGWFPPHGSKSKQR